LLVMDIFPIFLARLDKQQANDLVAKLQQTIAAARKAGVPVTYVALGFREGYPEVSPANRIFSAYQRSSPDMYRVVGEHSIAPEIAPQPGDVTVTKRRISAFTGSDLEVVLRARQTQHLILTGISTSGVVLSTLREAADRDFQATVLSDACADADEEVHRVLLSKVFPRQAEVLTVDQWVAQIPGGV
jgi:nicotinamidase-related amidase